MFLYWLPVLLTNVLTDMFLNFVVKEDTLLDMVSCMTEDVGLVHQMPFACDRDGFAATLEKVKFIYFYAE